MNTGIIKNDGWNEIVGSSSEFCIDRRNPRIIVEINSINKKINAQHAAFCLNHNNVGTLFSSSNEYRSENMEYTSAY